MDFLESGPLAARKSTDAFWYQEARISGGLDLMGGGSGGGGRGGRSGGGGGGGGQPTDAQINDRIYAIDKAGPGGSPEYKAAARDFAAWAKKNVDVGKISDGWTRSKVERMIRRYGG